LDDLARDLRQIDAGATHLGPCHSRHRQQVVDEMPHALAARTYARQVVLPLRVEALTIVFQQDLREAGDGAQWPAQIVAHRVAERCQLTVGGRALGDALLELGVEAGDGDVVAAAYGEVTRGGNEADERSGPIVDGGERSLGEILRSVFAQ